ncbi:CAH2-like protein [Mya arenaria]|uniref:Carbonic anhydrase n=1 Tax=Mya arenaria TaxID=6604 RepID=A0ABY7E5N7_MYAAR|nr:CAH2-like protein [Mya arenaria]
MHFGNMKLVILLVSLAVVARAEWSYSGASGPDFWALEYPACSKARQSPVQIMHEEAIADDDLNSFRFHGYDDIQTLDNLTVWNDGYTVTVRVHGDLAIEGGGLEGMYALQHFHFHWGSTDRFGSEHFLDGEAYPLEMHLVHKTVRHRKIAAALEDPKGLAVLGVFAKIGRPHPYFQAIIDNLRLLDIGDYANVRPFPMSELLPGNRETYYRYNGSLTTPPCSESVVWTVFREPIEISEEQIEQVRMLSKISNVTDNYRPIQSLNGRRIFVRNQPATSVYGAKESINNPSGDAALPLASLFLILAPLVAAVLKY